MSKSKTVKVTKTEIREAIGTTSLEAMKKIAEDFRKSVEERIDTFANKLVEDKVGPLAKDLATRLDGLNTFFESLSNDEYEWFKRAHKNGFPELMRRGYIVDAIAADMKEVVEKEVSFYYESDVDSIRKSLSWGYVPSPAVYDVGTEVLNILSTQEAKDARKAINDIRKLKREIDTIIDKATSGSKAYEKLTELGVDLSELDKRLDNLPTKVKLSVDPSLINPVKPS